MPHDIDLQAPFIAEDGFEYADIGDYILQKPIVCWRNQTLQRFRAEGRSEGRSEAGIREWLKGYDGDDPTPSCLLDQEARIQRHVRANFAASPFGLVF